MPSEITTINYGVNCFLIKTGSGFFLVDTGVANKRLALEKELERQGCQPGSLKLVILTHGDSDHADNSAYLQQKYGAKIAMHQDDAGMVERGDMSWNRKPKPDKVAFFFRLIMLVFSSPVKFDTFKPDVFLEDNQDLSPYGLDARVLHLPGHSKGSIGILTASGDLFAGDLLSNFFKPGVHFIDDLVAWNSSIEKLKQMEIKTVYPGHGKPFSMEKFLKNLH
jgi:glyoxylase-like metal-dependent hydrolase (beta-lactamase superfamily II)